MIAHKVLDYPNNNYTYEFAICTLVTNWEEYAIMKDSFCKCGFVENCEYIVADNVQENTTDAYKAIAGFIKTNSAKYLLIVHQDVRCIDNKQQLLDCLAKLTEQDKNWALCGNAGAMGYHNDMCYITNNGKIVKSNNLPAKANSLDENFLLINTSTSITISANITGFHLYGTDLAMIAEYLGYSCYVIPFMVRHISLGNLAELEKQVGGFVAIYGNKLRARYMQTACTKFYLSNSRIKNKIYNLPFVFFFVKAVQRFKQIKQLLAKGRYHKKTIVFEE